MNDGRYPDISSRTDFPRLIDGLGFKIGAEVGVFKGEFSSHLLSMSKLDRLFSIDPWLDAKGEFATEIHGCCNRELSQFGVRSVVLKMTGIRAAKRFQDSSLDFVYIDAYHSYESVKEDIETWFPKVRIGGVLSGHDYHMLGIATCEEYTTKKEELGRCEVKKAVDEFVAARSIDLRVINEFPPGWWFVKVS